MPTFPPGDLTAAEARSALRLDANSVAGLAISPAMLTPMHVQPIDGIGSPDWRMRAIAMRLHLRNGERLPFDHVSTAVTDEKAFVFLVVKKQLVTLEDDINLFPSDTLITQLRLLA